MRTCFPIGGAGIHQLPRLGSVTVGNVWHPLPVVCWWKRFICQRPNGQTNYQCKLISWFKLSTAVALPKHRAWLLNREKVHVLVRYTRDCVNEWDWVYGNEINVLVLLGVALWIPMKGNSLCGNDGEDFTSSLSVRILMWIYGVVPHTVAQTFCLNIGSYEMKVYASTSRMAFVKIVAILCHGHLHFRHLRLFVRL